ncbi:MAG: hypothetical protein ACJAUH_000880 [Saprospiraceae bacterium]
MKLLLPNFLKKYIMKLKLLFFLLILSVQSYGQQRLFHLPIDLKENNKTLTLGDLGGLNNPQYSDPDLNNDGINDLIVFDRTDNRFFTFINNGTPNTIDYTYAPKYAKNFPDANKWALTRDYNCDGIPDLFARPIQPIDGIAVWQGSYNSNNELIFSRIPFYPNPVWFTDVLFYYTPASNFPAVVNVINTDIPAIDDIDGDGDLDILSFRQTGGYMVYYENMSQEMGYGCDSLIFELRTDCWGRFLESPVTNDVNLSTGIDSCYGTIYFVGKGEKGNQLDTIHGLNNGSSRHAGSFTLSLDLNNDGAKEILLGDISFSNMTMLTNGYNADTAWMNAKDSNFPSYDVPIQMDIFPAAFHLDVNNDNKKDLLIAPNEPNASENILCTQFYENQTSDAFPDFQYIQDDFLVGDMLDVGAGAAPTFFDYNADGLEDLIVGSYGQFTLTGVDKGRLFLYENTGTATEPEFSLVNADYLSVSALNLKGLVPTFGDIDGDNDEDLMLGLADGTLYFFENTAGAGNPATFANVVPQYQGIDVGTNAAPQLIDLNRDGLMDMVIGEFSGVATFHENSGTIGNPQFSVVTTPFPNNSLGAIDVRPIGNSRGFATPQFYDNNGNYELFVGSETGSIYHYDSIDNNLGGMFALRSLNFSNLYEGYYVKIAISDINNDGFRDFVIGNERGGVRFYSLDTSTTFTNRIIKKEALTINLYPNPTTDFIVLDFEENIYKNITIQIVNTLGQLIQNQSFDTINQTERIELNNLPKGLYYCRVQADKGSWIQSFIIR